MKKVGCVAWGKNSQSMWPGGFPGVKRAGQTCDSRAQVGAGGAECQVAARWGEGLCDLGAGGLAVPGVAVQAVGCRGLLYCEPLPSWPGAR